MDVTRWLLESDPAIRWQVLRDLTDASEEEVARERLRIAHEGWGGALLDLQGGDGMWDRGAYYPDWLTEEYWDDHDGQPWTATGPTLLLLRQLGVDPHDERVVEAIRLVDERVRWEDAGQRFFEGETEPCVNALTVDVGSYFGVDVSGVVDRLLGERLADGGWNCEASKGSTRSSFHTTIAVVEALHGYEIATGGDSVAREARLAAEQYLLDRRLMYRSGTDEIIDASWLDFSFPVRWFYDVLRGLDHFRAVGADAADPRFADALRLVRDKRGADGMWVLENPHEGETQLDFGEGDGRPSRWNTLRALRVLRWAGDPA
ncbi:hypothetical protein [Herbiconiux sp. L3-i23]|uniref:hypothetical protein n=1 Tax=Herbiconiux sp. L3-i23 TaxID=2905871 RepID=UPI0020596537|nr:hypothetical protein [Herbiconiux sp. L3-i23]BDI22330.1 hypothetical protein L3i23_11060 [Herbiconiux sp. L3-i23]